MKALKIIAVVLGALLVLSGIGLLVGSSFAGVGQQAFDSELTRQGFGGPVKGRVTDASGQYYTVEFTDKDGDARTGNGPVADGTSPPSVGDEVTVLYLLEDPDRIVIINLGPAADITGIGNALRIGGIVCLVVGGILLAVGIIGLVMGRRRSTPPAVGPPGGYPPAAQAGPPPAAQGGPPPAPQAAPPPAYPQGAPPANYPPAPPPSTYAPGPSAAPPETGPPGPRPDYLGGPPGPSNPGGPPAQPPR